MQRFPFFLQVSLSRLEHIASRPVYGNIHFFKGGICMNQLEREVIGYMRTTLASLDTDASVVRENYYKAQDLFEEHLMKWSDAFALLYNGMLTIYRAHTPHPKGHYRNRHLEVGYTGYSFQTWVKDKVQPPIPSADELVSRFDKLINEYANSGEA